MNKGRFVGDFFTRAFAILVLSGGSIGCASGRVHQLGEDVGALSVQVQEMRNVQAENTAGLNEIRAQLAQLSGKLDETQHLAKGRTEELQRTLELVSSRVPPPAGVPEALLNADDERISRIASPAAGQYRAALQALRSARFEEARATFEAFIAQNPSTAFTDNALFWSGIAFEKLGQTDRAVGAYGDVYQRFPAEDFAPVALYRLAELFEESGSTSEARLAMQKVVDDYPRSAEAAKARQFLAARKAAPAPARKKR